MASADWTYLDDVLSGSSMDYGATAGVARPPGGGTFVYAMNALDAAVGVVALFTNQLNFAPAAKGASVRGAMQRMISNGPVGFSPYLFCCLGGTNSGGTAYMLGLTDADPHRIALRKGTLAGGIPDAATVALGQPLNSGIIAKSTATFAQGSWIQLRLDVIVNNNGDNVINCYVNDLTAGGASVATPSWALIPGIPQFIDDLVQINTGSAPLTSGRMGFGGQKSATGRRMAFDQLETYYQI